MLPTKINDTELSECLVENLPLRPAARSKYRGAPMTGEEIRAAFDRASMTDKLNALTDEDKYGIVLRAKGIVAATDGGNWIHFDYVPGEPDVREGGAAVIGRLCIIGANLNMPALSELFGVELK